MAIPNLAPNYLGQVKGIRAQREENERDRSFQADQASKNFLRKLGGDVLGAAFDIGGDIAGSAYRDSLTKNERAAAAGTYYPDDAVMGDNSAAIRQVAESRAATELRPQASYGGAVESGFGRRGIDEGAPTLGGVKAEVLRPQPPPVRAPTPAAPSSNPMLTPGIEAQFGRVLNAPVAPPGLAPRGMEAEAPRRPVAAPPSPIAQRPAPMAQPREMRSPEVYAPPRMMPSTAAAMARETGYRDAIPSMPTQVRGLAQQSQDVRDERALGLELQRKKLLWDEQQATANVEMMQQRGASATAIAAARAKEADAKAKAEEMRQLDLLMSARSRGAPKYVRGLGVYTPPQTVLPTGNTDDGLRGDIVPQGRMGRQGGTGGGRGGAGASAGTSAGEAPTGDVLTLVVQTRDRKGNPVGPSQPRRMEEGPTLWRSVAASPVDYGMNAAQSAQYKEAFRAFNAALPSARKGDATALNSALKAQDAMRAQLLAGQGSYAPDVAATREGFGTSPKDVATEQNRNDIIELRRQIDAQNRAEGKASGQTAALGDVAGDLAKLARPVGVDPSDVAKSIESQGIATVSGDRVMVGPVPLMRGVYQSAVNGLDAPPAVQNSPMMFDAYNKVKAQAATARQKLAGDAAFARGKQLEGLAFKLQARGVADPVAVLRQMGAEIPEGFKLPDVAPPMPGPAPARPQAPAQSAAQAILSASNSDELFDTIQTMPGVTGPQKEALFKREAALRGWE